MGYSTRSGGIGTFWPDNTDTVIYIPYGTSLVRIIERAKEKWGDDIDFNDIEITPQYIHTDCLYYDEHDPSDWTNFLEISYTKGE